MELRVVTAENEILEALHANAAGHANNSDGLFVIDSFEPKTLPEYLSLSSRVKDNANMRAHGNRLKAQQLNTIADVVDPRYRSIDRKVTDPEHLLAFSAMGELLRGGFNVALAQSHGEPRDIAFDLGFKSIQLSSMGIHHKTAMILSKGFDFLRIDTSNFEIDPGIISSMLENLGIIMRKDRTIALRSFLGIVADSSYFVIPSSASFEPIRQKHSSRIRKYNEGVLSLIGEDLTEVSDEGSGVLLSLAVTGTTPKRLDIDKYLETKEAMPDFYETLPDISEISTEDKVEVIGTISNRVYEYLRYCFTFASGIVLDTGHSRQDVRPEFVVVNDQSDIPRIGEKLAQSLDRLHPGDKFVQDLNKNLPLLRA